MNIAQATVNDIKIIAPLFNKYRIFYGQEDNINLAFDFLYSRIKNNESMVFYAFENNNSIVGFTQLYPSFSSISATRSIILNDLFVLETKRNLGVATKLIEHVFQFCKINNIKNISLQTHKNNLDAQKIYTKLNFERDDDFYVFNKFLDTN